MLFFSKLLKSQDFWIQIWAKNVCASQFHNNNNNKIFHTPEQEKVSCIYIVKSIKFFFPTHVKSI